MTIMGVSGCEIDAFHAVAGCPIWNRVSGHSGAVSAGLTSASFNALRIEDFASHDVIVGAAIIDPTTDKLWFSENFIVFSMAANSEANVWLSHRSTALVMYGVGFVADGATPHNLTPRLWSVDFTVDASNPTFTVLATGSNALPANVVRWIEIRWDDTSSPSPVEVWINDTQEINYAGSTGITVTKQTSLYQRNVVVGDKDATDIISDHDNAFWNDEAGATENGRLTQSAGYQVQGHQPNADVPPHGFTTTPAGEKKHACIDDFNDAASEGAGDKIRGNVGEEQRLDIANLALANPTIRFVQLYYLGNPVVLDDSVICIERSGVGHTYTKAWVTMTGNKYCIPLVDAPGSFAWNTDSGDVFDTLQVTLKSKTTNTDVLVLACEVGGTGLSTKPTQTPTNGNADGTSICPAAAASLPIFQKPKRFVTVGRF